MTVLVHWEALLATRRRALRRLERRRDWWRAYHRRLISQGAGAGKIANARREVVALRKQAAEMAVLVRTAERVVARHSHPTATGERGLRFIEEFEGGRSSDGLFHPYWDAQGLVWTQGYGVTGHGIGPNSRPWTQREADMWLRRTLAREYEPAVEALAVADELTQWEYDALVSIVWNLGVGILDVSHDIGKALRSSDWRHALPKVLPEYSMAANGSRPAGLVRRRAAEARLFSTGHYA